jgi:hypothetical protein
MLVFRIREGPKEVLCPRKHAQPGCNHTVLPLLLPLLLPVLALQPALKWRLTLRSPRLRCRPARGAAALAGCFFKARRGCATARLPGPQEVILRAVVGLGVDVVAVERQALALAARAVLRGQAAAGGGDFGRPGLSTAREGGRYREGLAWRPPHPPRRHPSVPPQAIARPPELPTRRRRASASACARTPSGWSAASPSGWSAAWGWASASPWASPREQQRPGSAQPTSGWTAAWGWASASPWGSPRTSARGASAARCPARAGSPRTHVVVFRRSKTGRPVMKSKTFRANFRQSFRVSSVPQPCPRFRIHRQRFLLLRFSRNCSAILAGVCRGVPTHPPAHGREPNVHRALHCVVCAGASWMQSLFV